MLSESEGNFFIWDLSIMTKKAFLPIKIFIIYHNKIQWTKRADQHCGKRRGNFLWKGKQNGRNKIKEYAAANKGCSRRYPERSYRKEKWGEINSTAFGEKDQPVITYGPVFLCLQNFYWNRILGKLLFTGNYSPRYGHYGSTKLYNNYLQKSD